MVVEPLKKTAVQEAQRLNSLSGKRIRWIFADGPIPATTFEHSFNEDGSVTCRWAAEGSDGDGEVKAVVRSAETRRPLADSHSTLAIFVKTAGL